MKFTTRYIAAAALLTLSATAHSYSFTLEIQKTDCGAWLVNPQPPLCDGIPAVFQQTIHFEPEAFVSTSSAFDVNAVHEKGPMLKALERDWGFVMPSELSMHFVDHGSSMWIGHGRVNPGAPGFYILQIQVTDDFRAGATSLESFAAALKSGNATGNGVFTLWREYGSVVTNDGFFQYELTGDARVVAYDLGEFTLSPVPEPSNWVLLAVGAIALAARRQGARQGR